MEYKVISAQPKEIDGRTVTGLAAVFGNIDGGNDRLWKGAFKKTIGEAGRRVKHLWMHDPYQPPTATVKDLSEVGADSLPDEVRGAYPEATGGLLVVREYLDTPRGNEILEGIKAGAISEMSFGYDPIKFDFEDFAAGEKKTVKVRNLREVRLWDVSDVTWGMNAATVASKLAFAPILQAYKDQMPEEQFTALENLVQSVYGLIDSDVVKSGQGLTAPHLEQLNQIIGTLNGILTPAEPPNYVALTEVYKLRIAVLEQITNTRR